MRGGEGTLRLRGYTLVEALISLLLVGLVVGAATSLLAGQRKAAEGAILGSEVLEAGLTTRRLLHWELRNGEPGRDWWVDEGDSVALRAYRGTGTVCAAGPGGREVQVAYRGVRLPNPAKDSVAVLDARGRWWVVGMESQGASDGCPETPPGDGEIRILRLAAEVLEPVLVRVFERGSYHLADRAFRYRVGLGGRQPLTPERFATGPSGIRGANGVGKLGGVEVLMAWEDVAPFSRPRARVRRVWSRDGG